MKRVAFILAFSALLHLLIWLRLVRKAELPRTTSRVLGAALLVLALVVPFGMFGLLPRSLGGAGVWVALTWLGFLFFLTFLLIPAEILRGALTVARRPMDAERRRVLGRAVGGAVGLAALGLGSTAVYTALRQLAVKRVRVPLAKLPRAMHGFTIVQLTDVHVGPTIRGEFVDDLVAKVNAEQPDVVVITGDLVDGSVQNLGDFVAKLAGLKSRHGTYFVTGNHEYYSGAEAWIAHLGTLGIRVLRNERVTLTDERGQIDLSGVDDAHAHRYAPGHGMDVAEALRGRDPDRTLVLLAHQPRAIFDAAAGGVDLQLSGHTHGGQLFPWNFLVKLDQPYVTGLHLHESTHIYVSEGTGYWGPPMRLGTRAEITRLELVCPALA